MFCPKCGAPANENQTCCTNCGAPLAPQTFQSSQQTLHRAPGFGLAIASMVLGICSLALFCVICLAIPCAIIGIILGGIALRKAKKAQTKSGMAVAGIVCSCVSLGILIVLIIIGAAALTLF